MKDCTASSAGSLAAEGPATTKARDLPLREREPPEAPL